MKHRLWQMWWKMKKTVKEAMEDQDGIGVVELILILVILIALVLIFKNQIYDIVTGAFDSISTNTDSIVN